jgi:hypothetical protein
MKKNLLTIVSALSAMVFMNSCGTMIYSINKGKATVSLLQAPQDLQVKMDGKRVEIVSEVFAATGNTHTTTQYYTSAIKLPHKKKATIELYSPSTGKKSTVAIKPTTSGTIIAADLSFGFGVGLIVDLVTGNYKKLSPRLIDVQNSLDGKKWIRHGKLKRIEKKRIKRSYK